MKPSTESCKAVHDTYGRFTDGHSRYYRANYGKAFSQERFLELKSAIIYRKAVLQTRALYNRIAVIASIVVAVVVIALVVLALAF